MTQIEMIKNQLITTGEVSRNWCLQRYCSRLGARIEDLEKEGWIFKTETRKKSDEEQGDYIYKLVSKPQTVFNPQIYSTEFLERQERKKQMSLI